jgi:hypothetical protein
MPPGVRLISWKLNDPPIRIERLSIVTEPALFARVTIEQLGAALAGKQGMAGHWSVSGLRDRLETSASWEHQRGQERRSSSCHKADRKMSSQTGQFGSTGSMAMSIRFRPSPGSEGKNKAQGGWVEKFRPACQRRLDELLGGSAMKAGRDLFGGVEQRTNSEREQSGHQGLGGVDHGIATMPAPGWLTAEEAADHLRVKTRTLLLWTRQGKVKGYPLSGSQRHIWRYRMTDLDGSLGPPSVPRKR